MDHRETEVVSEVMRLTDGRGVDLVVDAVGATLQDSLAVLRPEGRLVFVGKAGRGSFAPELWGLLRHNQTLLGVYMGTQFEKPEVYPKVGDMLEEATRG